MVGTSLADAHLNIINNSKYVYSANVVNIGTNWGASFLVGNSFAAESVDSRPITTSAVKIKIDEIKLDPGLSFTIDRSFLSFPQFDLYEYRDTRGYDGHCQDGIWAARVKTPMMETELTHGCWSDYDINIRISKDGRAVTVSKPMFKSSEQNYNAYNIQLASAIHGLQFQSVFMKPSLESSNTDYYPLNSSTKGIDIVEPAKIEKMQLEFEAVNSGGAREQKQVSLKLENSYCAPIYTLSVSGDTQYQNCVHISDNNKNILITFEPFTSSTAIQASATVTKRSSIKTTKPMSQTGILPWSL